MTITINGTTGLTFTDASTLSSATFSPVYPITASVATSALTVTLNPCSLAFRSSTLTSGSTVTRTVSTAISMTVSSGSTLGTVSAQQSRIIVLAIDNAGTVELAVVNISGGTQLDETNLISTTAEGGAGAADSASTVYSTTARTSLAYRVIGYIESTQATAGTWATAPSTIQGYGGQALSAMSSLGYGQTWVTNGAGITRALGTTYYNSTGKPIQASVTGVGTVNGSSLQMSATVNGVQAGYSGTVLGAGGAVCGAYISVVIPPNASYVFTNASQCALHSWSELR